jgi:hypothetical protein
MFFFSLSSVRVRDRTGIRGACSSYPCKEKNGEMVGKSYWEIKGKICLLLFLKSRREMG